MFHAYRAPPQVLAFRDSTYIQEDQLTLTQSAREEGESTKRSSAQLPPKNSLRSALGLRLTQAQKPLESRDNSPGEDRRESPRLAMKAFFQGERMNQS